MISLAQILDIEARYRPAHCLPDAFADGYLLSRVPTFRRVREFLLSAGYEFEKGGALLDLYRSAPLLSLPAILAGRSVPYLPNGSAIRALRASPEWTEIPLLQVAPFLTRNGVLHESAHLVAETLVPNQVASAPEQVFHALVAESFANTVEAISVCEAETELDRWFFSMHSPFTVSEETKRAYQKLLTEYGAARVAERLLWSFLRVNFLRESEADSAEWLALALEKLGLPATARADASELFRYASSLSALFRHDTAITYFRVFAGITDVSALLAEVPTGELFRGKAGVWVRALARFWEPGAV